jgi:hypothetical protein
LRDSDLAPFAVADGLLARIAAEPDRMSEAERDYLLFQGAKMLARVADLSGEEAYRLIHPFTEENRTTIQCSRTFACISAFDRLLFVINRRELAGLCHPERN